MIMSDYIREWEKRKQNQLSAHFTVCEFERSEAAISGGFDNRMCNVAVDNARALCANVLEPLRSNMRGSILIKSGYRCPDLNIAIKGARNSQHMTGEAADVFILGRSCKEVFDWIVKNCEFDQIILESSWVHVSYSRVRNRKQKLIALAGGRYELLK